MKGRITYAWPLGLMLLLVGLTLWLRQVIDVPTPVATSRQRHDTDSVVERFTMTRLGTDGRQEAQLSAQRMVHFADDEATELYSPQLVKREAGVTISVQADRGVINREYQDAQFYQNVHVVRREESSADELEVRTEYLHVLIDREILRTDQPVTINQGGSTLSGVGMEYDRKSGRLVLLSGVKARFQPKPREGKS